MKKILLNLALGCFGFAISSNAQVKLTQDFEGVTMPALPAGWSIGGSTGSPAWFTSSTAESDWGTKTGTAGLPSHTQFAIVDDDLYPSQLHDTLMSPVFSLTGTSSVWLNFDCFFYGATNTKTSITEHAYVLGSMDGGATWSVIDSVAPEGWGGSWVTQHTSLASLSGSNCKIAYTYTDNGGALIGCAVDNISVLNLTANDAALTSLNYNSVAAKVSANGEPVSVTVQNMGVPITSLTLYYTINGGSAVSQTFSPTGFAPYTSQTFTFTSPISGAVSGSNILRIVGTTVNGAANVDVDSAITSTFALASSEVQRQGLVEEFTSSTCPPCQEFAVSFDPLCNSLNADNGTSNFNIIKYQMNWPDWDDDRSYNADGNDRRGNYGVDAIPEHLVNGVVDNYSWSYPFSTADNTYFTNEFAAASAIKSFMDLSVTYSVDTIKKVVYAVTKITPHFTATGTYHLQVMVADKHYQNIGNEWGMLDYYNVMRKMFPSGNGRSITSFTDGVAQTFYDTAISYTNGDWVPASLKPADSSGEYPRQGSFTFWNNPLLGSELLAFVQEDASQSIMQSVVTPATDGSTIAEHHVGVSTLSKVYGLNIYPNPAKDEATVHFSLAVSGNVEISVMEYTGRVVSNVVNEEMTAGQQNVVIPTNNILPGNYLVVVKTESGTNVERLTVIK